MAVDSVKSVRDLLRALPRPSPEAAADFLRNLPKLLVLVSEKASFETKYHKDHPQYDKSRTLEEGHRWLGESLACVYEMDLYEALADEFAWFVSVFSSRGFGADFIGRTLEAWANAVHFGLPASASAELAPPLEILRANVAAFMGYFPLAVAEPNPPPEFLSSILAGDRHAAASYALELLKNGASPRDTVDRAVVPALREIGARWQRNELGVADEHAATAACGYVLYRVFDAAPRPKPLSRKALIACTPGEEHELGASIAAYYMELEGWEVYYIGRSLPTQEVVEAATREKPAAVLFATMLISRLPAARDLARRVREATPAVKIVMGGRAAATAREKLADVADAVAANIEEGVAAASSLAGNDA
jgi:methanogenic corrinoid protein MtbC1